MDSGKDRTISVVKNLSDQISALSKKGFIGKQDPISVYGLNRLSFAVRTILVSHGYRMDSYIEPDEGRRSAAKREEKYFASRYLNDTRDLIPILGIDEAAENHACRILIPSVDTEAEKNEIKQELRQHGLEEGKQYVFLYDKMQDPLSGRVRGLSPIGFDELRELEKNILAYVDQFCMEHKLRYWVCGGTLLGVIRHQGFIPWDDDIDIFLPWEDYCRFQERFDGEGKYRLVKRSVERPGDFTGSFCRVLDEKTVVIEDEVVTRRLTGVWVDIFPLIGMPADADERTRFFAEYLESEKAMWESFYTSDGSMDDFSKWYIKHREILSRYDFDQSQAAGVFGTKYRDRDSTRRSVYDTTLRLPFEDIKVNVPGGYEEYLSNLYGRDYMIPPDMQGRKSLHSIEAYYL